MLALIAQLPVWSISHWAIVIVVVAAVCAIVFVALKQFGIAIPAWVIQVFWIMVVAVVCILAIKFLAGM